ncbi:MAG: hypothetical protein ABFD18_18600 [Syntrophomonas sp.]
MAAQAVNTTEAGSYKTLFNKDEVQAIVKAVKYSAGDDTGNFDTDAAYTGAAIANNDFFIIRVTEPHLSRVSYYKIMVTVNPPAQPVIQPAQAGNAYVKIYWNAVLGASAYKIYMRTASDSYGAELATVGESVYSYDATGLINGQSIQRREGR